jgi:hypothetical protein
MSAAAQERFTAASDYIKENFEPRDRIALLILNRESGESMQRITSAEKASSPEFQAWLCHRNAIGDEIYIGMNPLKPDAAKRSVWRKHTTDPKTASAAKPVLVIEPLRELLAQLHQIELNQAKGPILRGVKGGPLELNMLVKRVIRPALRNRENYRDPRAENWKPLEWHGFYSLRRGIATHLAAITRDPMAAKGLLRHSSVNTTLTHYIKEVPEVTANGMAQVEQLFSRVDLAGQSVQ